MAFKGLGAFVDSTVEIAQKAAKQRLTSNASISKIGMSDWATGFKGAATNRIKNNQKLNNKIMGTNTGDPSNYQIAKSMFYNKEGDFQTGRAVGAGIAGAALFRGVTGGGWAVNGSGQRDLVGVPFI